jgi:hypothetical protein
MATPTRRPVLEPDLAAALRRLVAAFGAEQVTVACVQRTSRPNPTSGRAATPARAWQATLLEEAPCSSTCT